MFSESFHHSSWANEFSCSIFMVNHRNVYTDGYWQFILQYRLILLLTWYWWTKCLISLNNRGEQHTCAHSTGGCHSVLQRMLMGYSYDLGSIWNIMFTYLKHKSLFWKHTQLSFCILEKYSSVFFNKTCEGNRKRHTMTGYSTMCLHCKQHWKDLAYDMLIYLCISK